MPTTETQAVSNQIPSEPQSVITEAPAAVPAESAPAESTTAAAPVEQAEPVTQPPPAPTEQSEQQPPVAQVPSEPEIPVQEELKADGEGLLYA